MTRVRSCWIPPKSRPLGGGVGMGGSGERGGEGADDARFSDSATTTVGPFSTSSSWERNESRLTPGAAAAGGLAEIDLPAIRDSEPVPNDIGVSSTAGGWDLPA